MPKRLHCHRFLKFQEIYGKFAAPRKMDSDLGVAKMCRLSQPLREVHSQLDVTLMEAERFGVATAESVHQSWALSDQELAAKQPQSPRRSRSCGSSACHMKKAEEFICPSMQQASAGVQQEAAAVKPYVFYSQNLHKI